ncbi:MAG TPA: sigma-70 family RNA polymerase sigma factor [Opitutaceae bacterium]|nr:sigma-70 family RNA polymerase sigma factor [Opitutaceae bacterium]
MPPQDLETTRWFLTHLQTHEPQLRAWLASQFPGGQDIDDIVQEAFIRVLRARTESEVRSPKAFLFVVARNLVLMRLRHNKVAREESLAEIDSASILDDEADVPEAVARAQEIEMLTEAIQSLPTRCRQILTLRKIYGLSQKETAAELGIVEHTVEIQTALGLKKIGQFFRKHRPHH